MKTIHEMVDPSGFPASDLREIRFADKDGHYHSAHAYTALTPFQSVVTIHTENKGMVLVSTRTNPHWYKTLECAYRDTSPLGYREAHSDQLPIPADKMVALIDDYFNTEGLGRKVVGL